MTWSQLFLDPLKLLWDQLVFLLPRLFGGFLIMLVGSLVAFGVRQLIARVLQRVGVDRLAEQAKLSDALRWATIRITFVEMLSWLSYWLILVTTIMVALQFMGLTVAAQWLQHVGSLIPQLIVSLLVLLVGMFLASFLGTSVRAASLNAGVPQGHLVGQTVYAMMVLLTVVVALEQLPLQTRTIETTLYILVGALGLASALALGLGSQEFVKRWLAEVWERWKTSQR